MSGVIRTKEDYREWYGESFWVCANKGNPIEGWSIEQMQRVLYSTGRQPFLVREPIMTRKSWRESMEKGELEF